MSDKDLSPAPGLETDPAAGDDAGFDDAFDRRSNADEGARDTDDNGAAKAPLPDEDASGSSPDGEDEQAAKAPVEPAFNPYEGLSPAQAEHFRRLEQSERSQRGRVGALNKRLNQQAAARPPQQVRTPDNADAGGKPDIAALRERVNTAAEEYPDAVGPLKEMVEALGQQISEIHQQVTPLSEREQQAELEKAYEVLAGAHPDYIEVAADQNFHNWLVSQTDGIGNLARSNDPEEVSLALTLYKAETQRGQGDGGDPDPGQREADARRDRQLNATRDVPSRGAPASSATPNDFDAAFNRRANRNRR